MKKRIFCIFLGLLLMLCACSGAENAPAGGITAAPAASSGAASSEEAQTAAPEETADPGTAAEPETGETKVPEPALPVYDLASDTLYVKAVEDLPDGFIFGMDASSVIAEEESGVVYRGFDGEPQDVFLTLAQAGVTHIRVRVWNDPYDSAGHGYGGGNNDIDKAVQIGTRAGKYGLKLIVDFHYSDFWADPGKQMVPKAWKGMEIEEKAEAAYQYTRECLEKLTAAGVPVAMVQVGNETNGALCGETRWAGIQAIMQAGSRAVREVCPDALVAVHFANPEKADSYADYAWRLDYYSVDYDVFASSYYPYWHGTRENLSAVLTQIHETYGKQVMVMETSYAYTAEDTDFNGNTIGDGGGIVKDYPFTVQGQANSVRNVIETMAQTPGGIGACYWEGTWITVGGATREENEALWEAHGSGWASRYAAAYDPNDAGRYYGGCAVDNQAMFDAEGRPLESLKVFGLVREGSVVELVPDSLEDVQLQVDLARKVELPDTVNAVMNDDSRQAIPVTWKVTEEELAAMNQNGPADYTVTGEAGGMEARCFISMIEFNYLKNYSFEEGTLAPWTVEDLAKADELKLEEKATDSLTGDWHFHFWSAAENSVDFTLEQEVEDLPEGAYKYAISIMGGDGGETDIFAYVKIDGKVVQTAPLAITAWSEWHRAEISGIEVKAGQHLTAGIHVKCRGTGNGAWGKIDDALLNACKED